MTAKQLKNVIRNTRRLQEDKKFRFIKKIEIYGYEKAEKEKLKRLKKSVKEGIIVRTDEYKYLG